MRRTALIPVLLALAFAAGCTSGQEQKSSNAAADPADPAGVWREFVTCARTAGQADWPDAQVDANGAATFPDGFDSKTGFEAVKGTCASILNRLPTQVNPYNETMTPAQIEAMRRYVQCLHQNGMPDVPEPGPDGRFSQPDKYTTPEYATIYVQARTACDHILLEAK